MSDNNNLLLALGLGVATYLYLTNGDAYAAAPSLVPASTPAVPNQAASPSDVLTSPGPPTHYSEPVPDHASPVSYYADYGYSPTVRMIQQNPNFAFADWFNNMPTTAIYRRSVPGVIYVGGGAGALGTAIAELLE